MGIKKWFGETILGSKNRPVHKTTEARNRNVHEYQTFLRDYAFTYGKELVTPEFIANAEGSPSYKLWLSGKAYGAKRTLAGMPPELKAKYAPKVLEPKRIESLPAVFRAVKTNKVTPEVASGLLGFESQAGFEQVFKAIDSLVQENIKLATAIQQLNKQLKTAAQPKKRKRRRGKNKKTQVKTETKESESNESDFLNAMTDESQE